MRPQWLISNSKFRAKHWIQSHNERIKQKCLIEMQNCTQWILIAIMNSDFLFPREAFCHDWTLIRAFSSLLNIRWWRKFDHSFEIHEFKKKNTTIETCNKQVDICLDIQVDHLPMLDKNHHKMQGDSCDSSKLLYHLGLWFLIHFPGISKYTVQWFIIHNI